MIKSIFSHAFFGWLFFASLQVFSQTDRLSEFNWTNVDPTSGQKSDFVILNSGEKVFGKIIRNYNQAYYDQIVLETGGSVNTYLPKDIKGFGLDNGQLFHARYLPESSDLLFVQILVSGPIELSGYRGSFFLENGETYQKLEAYYKNTETNGYKRSKFYKPFIVALKTALTGDCGVKLYAKIERLPYSEQALIGLLESYYTCQGTAYQVHVEHAPFLKISPTAGLGLSYFSIQATQKTKERNDQLENNLGYQGFAGIRLHDFRNLPRVSTDLRIGFSMFTTTVLSSYEGSQLNWTGSEEIEEFAVYLPVSFNYSLLKNQQMEVYLGLSAGLWLMQTTHSGGIIDQKIFSSGEIHLQESEIVEVMDSNFIPGIKMGYNLGLSGKTRLMLELEANTQKDYYRFSLHQNQSEYSRGRVSFQLGLEF
ncbi:hypothetical protein [Algoriphagus sp. A40]|uniref:hypothetical protein n=1 Tax=Algoriphagus sp. A40 TaxID=1945863 RepID=UPI00098702B4|nr:hypothetical protein [Algoriphagus sp. A40]OOG76144.1 hypothetical protein B0E43_08845 [Algoriphagus sp. A40]